jgi:hypothetical protein
MVGKIILRLILEIQDGTVWTGLIWHRIVTSEGLSEHDNEPSSSIKFWEILE